MKKRMKWLWTWTKFIWWMVIFVLYIVIWGAARAIAIFMPRGRMFGRK